MTSSPQHPHAHGRARAVRAAAFALAGAAVLASGGARAEDCVNLPNPILGIGGSAATNLIKRIGTKLAAANPPITVVYADPGACQAMTALVPNATTSQVTPLSGTAKIWNAQGVESTCTFPSGSTTVAEWGAMAQEATTCQGIEALPATVGDYRGPISGFSLIVPNASSEFAISAEAVYYIYGLGAGTGHDVAPWTVPAAIGSRSTTSAAGLLLAKASGIPLSRALAYLPTNDVKTNQGAVDFITSTSAAAVQNPNAALAFCSTETADANRAKVRTLAFKAVDQDYAYFPDSSATATDKKNLREGRYFLWNVHHFFANKERLAANPNLQKFINIVTSTEEIPGNQSFLDLQIANGNVPTCAMKVTRQGDMGPLSSFSPDKPCGCYFDFKTTGSTTCKTCANDNECGTGSVCSHGYCEVK
ncbi:MAG TPA: hypothetical protein VI299_03170 [Polyangiales bacterium]